MGTLYQNLLGADFNNLSPLLQRFHIAPNNDWVGEAKIAWNKNPLLRFLLQIGGLPKEAKSEPITMCVRPEESDELWIRNIGGRRMVSKQILRGGSLRENFGPFSLALDTYIQEGCLHQSCSSSVFLGIPLPSMFAFKITAREWQENKRFNFDVEIGLSSQTLIHYRGWLVPKSLEA